MSDHSSWSIENIPDADILFLRVSRQWCPDLLLHPGVFKENKGSMSVDWAKYCTSQDTRTRQGEPQRFGIVELIAGPVRRPPGIDDHLTVNHEPTQGTALPDNRAHSAVYGIESDGKRKLRIRTALYKRFGTWLIHPDDPF